MQSAVNALIGALENADSATLVRVVSIAGIGLRDANDGAVITERDGRRVVAGRILGGVVDDVLLASHVDGRSVQDLTVNDDEAERGGLLCGGRATVLRTPVADLPAEIGPFLRQAQPLALVARADGLGGDLLVTRRATAGSLNATGEDGKDTAAPEPLVEAARSLLADGTTASAIVRIDGVDHLVTAIVSSTRLLIAGSGPMAEAIAAQGDLLGWTTTTSESVRDGEAFLAEAGPSDAFAVLSHDAGVDVPLLHAALGSSIGYIGGMGSRGTQSRRRDALVELGHTAAALERIHGPIGLDLGSRTPAETAVAIAAEFLANRSGKTPGRLTDGSGPING